VRLTDIAREFGVPPEPWVEGRTIPWDDPDFSRRMLPHHLSQDRDSASRRSGLIERHIEFLREHALPDGPARILDLGCGPGLYAHRLAALGHECFGVDIGPASIEYARQQAAAFEDRCRFALGDIREVDFGAGYDLVMLLFGEFNLFDAKDTARLLERATAALAPGRTLVLEVHSFEAVRDRGETPPSWTAVESGLFSERPYLHLEESFWLPESAHAAGRHWIVDAATGEVTRHGWTMKAHTDASFEALLSAAGLRLTARFDTLAGDAGDLDFPVLLATLA
jgi:SAM-dependent methyltransferase